MPLPVREAVWFPDALFLGGCFFPGDVANISIMKYARDQALGWCYVSMLKYCAYIREISTPKGCVMVEP